MVENSYGRRVIDEHAAIYTIGECRKVTVNRSMFQSGSYVFGVIDTYYYHKTYTSAAPPMVFMRTAGYSGLSFISNWYNNIRVKYYGSAGAWTVTLVRVVVSIGYQGASSAWMTTWDPRKLFIVVGAGVQPNAGETGMVVYNASGKATFNSNTNIFNVKAYSNSWYKVDDNESTTVFRAGGGSYGKRHQVWELGITPTSTDWVLVNPTQEYRRYNGEVGFAWTCRVQAGAKIWRGLQTGNSGTPVHGPVITGFPQLPLLSSTNPDGTLRWCYT